MIASGNKKITSAGMNRSYFLEFLRMFDDVNSDCNDKTEDDCHRQQRHD